jgi:hypothetical protein
MDKISPRSKIKSYLMSVFDLATGHTYSKAEKKMEEYSEKITDQRAIWKKWPFLCLANNKLF